MGFSGVPWKNNIQMAYLPKTSIPEQIVFEILAHLCSDDSVRIALNQLTQFITFGTESNLEGFVWRDQSKIELVSPRQFATQC